MLFRPFSKSQYLEDHQPGRFRHFSEDDPQSRPRGLKPFDPLPYVYTRQVFKLFSGLSFKCRGLKAPRPSCLKYLKKLFSRFFFFSQSSALEMPFLSVVSPESSSNTYTLKGLFSLFFFNLFVFTRRRYYGLRYVAPGYF